MPALPGAQKKSLKKRRREHEKHHRSPPRDVVAELVRRAVLLPRGPSLISAHFARPHPDIMPPLVTVILTRKTPDGLLIPAVALVDRTCLGVKSGYIGPPMTELDLDDFCERYAERQGAPMVPCELLVAQSIVFHAIDYAAALGFAPDPDFPAALFGPRPEVLLDTPLAHRARPLWVCGPYDDQRRIIHQLDRAVGPGNYDLVTPAA